MAINPKTAIKSYVPAFTVISFLLFLACTPSTTFSEFHSFPQTMWDKNEPIRFTVPINDTTQRYDFFIQVRNNNQYPFSNLWLFVDVKMPDGTVRSDTINITLADVYGKWLGKGISLYTYSHFHKNIQFPNTGDYIFTIRQGMRSDIITGISEVGIRLEPNNQPINQ